MAKWKTRVLLFLLAFCLSYPAMANPLIMSPFYAAKIVQQLQHAIEVTDDITNLYHLFEKMQPGSDTHKISEIRRVHKDMMESFDEISEELLVRRDENVALRERLEDANRKLDEQKRLETFRNQSDFVRDFNALAKSVNPIIALILSKQFDNLSNVDRDIYTNTKTELAQLLGRAEHLVEEEDAGIPFAISLANMSQLYLMVQQTDKILDQDDFGSEDRFNDRIQFLLKKVGHPNAYISQSYAEVTRSFKNDLSALGKDNALPYELTFIERPTESQQGVIRVKACFYDSLKVRFEHNGSSDSRSVRCPRNVAEATTVRDRLDKKTVFLVPTVEQLLHCGSSSSDNSFYPSKLVKFTAQNALERFPAAFVLPGKYVPEISKTVVALEFKLVETKDAFYFDSNYSRSVDGLEIVKLDGFNLVNGYPQFGFGYNLRKHAMIPEGMSDCLANEEVDNLFGRQHSGLEDANELTEKAASQILKILQYYEPEKIKYSGVRTLINRTQRMLKAANSH